MKPKRKNPVDRKILVRVLRAENRRLREDLNEQTAYADEYHASLTELHHAYTKLEKERCIRVGKFGLARLRSGMLWLQLYDEEGMQVNEKEFEAALSAFMAKHF